MIAVRAKYSWPALTLFFLSPLIGEMLIGVTRLSHVLEPVRFITVVVFYGAGALLVRETVRRRRLGLAALLLLGMAYGTIEEGLALQTYFNPAPYGQDASYGRALGINWPGVIIWNVYHPVWSIAVPIAVVGLLFPMQRKQSWLSNREYALTGAAFGAATLFFYWIFQRRGHGAPWWGVVGVLVIAAALALTALRVGKLHRRTAGKSPRPLLVGIAGALGSLAWFGLIMFIDSKPTVAAVWPCLAAVLVAALGAGLAAHWAGQLWTMRHTRALVFGLLTPSWLFGMLVTISQGNPLDAGFVAALGVLGVAYGLMIKRQCS